MVKENVNKMNHTCEQDKKNVTGSICSGSFLPCRMITVMPTCLQLAGSQHSTQQQRLTFKSQVHFNSKLGIKNAFMYFFAQVDISDYQLVLSWSVLQRKKELESLTLTLLTSVPENSLCTICLIIIAVRWIWYNYRKMKTKSSESLWLHPGVWDLKPFTYSVTCHYSSFLVDFLNFWSFESWMLSIYLFLFYKVAAHFDLFTLTVDLLIQNN